jgi:hypothetical protein
VRGAGRALVTLVLLLAVGAGVLYLLREQPFDLPTREPRDLSPGDGVVVYPLR